MVTKNNQVVPDNDMKLKNELVTITVPLSSEQLMNSTPPSPIMSRNHQPILPVPLRRKLINETELANALTFLQQQQDQQRCHYNNRRQLYRRRKRSIGHRTKTPALSPIRESGLSNPASPSHQNCNVSEISSTCL